MPAKKSNKTEMLRFRASPELKVRFEKYLAKKAKRGENDNAAEVMRQALVQLLDAMDEAEARARK